MCAVYRKEFGKQLAIHTMMLSLPLLADAPSPDTACAEKRARAPLPESFMFVAVVVACFCCLIAVVCCYCMYVCCFDFNSSISKKSVNELG